MGILRWLTVGLLGVWFGDAMFGLAASECDCMTGCSVLWPSELAKVAWNEFVLAGRGKDCLNDWLLVLGIMDGLARKDAKPAEWRDGEDADEARLRDGPAWVVLVMSWDSRLVRGNKAASGTRVPRRNNMIITCNISIGFQQPKLMLRSHGQ